MQQSGKIQGETFSSALTIRESRNPSEITKKEAKRNKCVITISLPFPSHCLLILMKNNKINIKLWNATKQEEEEATRRASEHGKRYYNITHTHRQGIGAKPSTAVAVAAAAP